MLSTTKMLAALPFMMICSGCCLFNCNVNDLRFESLPVPTASEIKKESSKRDLARLTFSPDTLKLRFSTEQNLPELQRSNDTYGSSIYLTLCSDISGIVSIGDIATEDGMLFDNIFNRDFPGTGNQLTRASDGRITYETVVRVKRVMHEVRDERFGGLTKRFTTLPTDPNLLPALCFNILSGGYLTRFGSNLVPIPTASLARAVKELGDK